MLSDDEFRARFRDVLARSALSMRDLSATLSPCQARTPRSTGVPPKSRPLSR